MNNKHPHHDLIVEFSGDMSKKIYFYSKPLSRWCASNIEDLSSDINGKFKFLINPRGFTNDTNKKVRCSKIIRCRWKGIYSEMKSREINYFELKIKEKVCPRCGNNELY